MSWQQLQVNRKLQKMAHYHFLFLKGPQLAEKKQKATKLKDIAQYYLKGFVSFTGQH